MTGDPERVTCHRLCFVMVSRHLVMLAMQSLDMLYYVMCFLNLPVTSDPKRVSVTGFALSCCSVPRLRVPRAATTSNPEIGLRYLGFGTWAYF